MQFCSASPIVLLLVLVLEFFPHRIDHEHEQEHDYEKAVVIWRVLATFPARERRCVCRSAHLACYCRPNQRMRSRRSLTEKTIR
jgi:hypothetical protein